VHFGETKPIGGVSDRAHSHPVLPAKAATHDLRRWSWVPGSPPLARGRPGRRSDGCREEPTCTCGRRGSIVCGLLFTMKIPTQACEPFASAAVNAQHRHPSLPGLTPQVGFTRLAAYNVSEPRQARVACNPSSSKKVFAKTDGPPGQARGRREPAESTGCACLLFSSCYVLLFGGHQLRETGARSSPFPVLFRCVTSKTRGGRLYPRSCFSPVIYRGRSGHVVLEAGQAPVCARLSSWPRFCAAQRCCFGSEAAFDLHGRLQPGPRHFQQDLAVPLRFGLAGPTQTLLREFAEFCGRCRHARARLRVNVSAYLAMRQS
jgi:hypothetical protein